MAQYTYCYIVPGFVSGQTRLTMLALLMRDALSLSKVGRIATKVEITLTHSPWETCLQGYVPQVVMFSCDRNQATEACVPVTAVLPSFTRNETNVTHEWLSSSLFHVPLQSR